MLLPVRRYLGSTAAAVGVAGVALGAADQTHLLPFVASGAVVKYMYSRAQPGHHHCCRTSMPPPQSQGGHAVPSPASGCLCMLKCWHLQPRRRQAALLLVWQRRQIWLLHGSGSPVAFKTWWGHQYMIPPLT
jgi:hypothetical protein